MAVLQLVAIIVHEHDPAIRFFVDVLGFELAEDSPATATDGKAKRWVVVRPPGAQTGILSDFRIDPCRTRGQSVLASATCGSVR